MMDSIIPYIIDGFWSVPASFQLDNTRHMYLVASVKPTVAGALLVPSTSVAQPHHNS